MQRRPLYSTAKAGVNAKIIICNAKFIIFNAKFIICNAKFIIFNAKIHHRLQVNHYTKMLAQQLRPYNITCNASTKTIPTSS